MAEQFADESIYTKKGANGKFAMFDNLDRQITSYCFDSIEEMGGDYWIEDENYWAIIDKAGKYAITPKSKDNKSLDIPLWLKK